MTKARHFTLPFRLTRWILSNKFVNIILVEDNPLDVLVVRNVIEELPVNCRLDVYSDGEEILTYLANLDANEDHCPDLVLLDLNIPKSSGTEVLQWIRKSVRCQKLPVILLTSSDSPRDRGQAEKLGVAHYFKKPTDLDEYMKLGPIVLRLLSEDSCDKSGAS